MKDKIIYIVVFGLIFLIIGVKTKEYFECDFSIDLGGAATSKRPEHCDAQQKKQEKLMAKKFVDEYHFECKTQEKPEPPIETQELYDYAHYHDLHNMWDEKAGVWDSIAHYYRIAAAHGDYRANVRLQYLLEDGRVSSANAVEEIYALNQELAKQLPATAYYKTYGAIDAGMLETEEYGQYAFLRRAAELGSAEAQFEFARTLMRVDDDATHASRLKFANELDKCSAQNGYWDASIYHGMEMQDQKKYIEALQAFHNAIKQGGSQGASWLRSAFKYKSVPVEDQAEMYNLELELDLERSKRYAVIQDYLSTYDYLNPKVPDLDEIVPLPPAKLPEWDGKIAFQRWYEGASPKQPSEELVKKLAEAKGLDPKTGLALNKK